MARRARLHVSDEDAAHRGAAGHSGGIGQQVRAGAVHPRPQRILATLPARSTR